MHVYFSGIGGTGLFPLAQVAMDAGYQVSGSDLEDSPSIQQLKDKNIKVDLTQDGRHIESVHQETPIDWLVVSSAVPKESAEIKFAKEHDIRITKRDEFLLKILGDKNLKLVAVSGTHGKTTTSAMLVWLMQELGQDISYIVGSKPLFGPAGKYSEESRFFIYEADEYDRNFLSFQPDIAIITAVDYDHPDTYPTEEDYKEAFRKFIDSSSKVYAWQQDVDYLDIDETSKLQTLTDPIQELDLNGEHNRRNASLACRVVKDIAEAREDDLVKIINKYPGTERRLEKLAENVFTDYAHHPAEIKATLSGLLEKIKNVVIVYQPHQNVRQHLVQDAYGEVFNGVKKLYWLPTYLTREVKDQPVIAPDDIVAKLDESVDAKVADLNEQLADELKIHLQNSDTVVFMGAGPIDKWARNFSEKL